MSEQLNNRKYDSIESVQIIYMPKRYKSDEKEPRRRVFLDWDALTSNEKELVRGLFMRLGGNPE